MLASEADEASFAMALTFSNEIPPTDQFWELFQATGWNENYHLSAAQLGQAIRGSWFVVAGYDDGNLVGFGRLVSDGVLHAMIYELIVAPPYQNQGLGSQILARLIGKCQEHHIRDIQPFCARGKRAFYEKRGFASRPEEAPGMQFKASLWDCHSKKMNLQ
jgi:GNAT superfamily N-acetyltransferase